MQLSSLFAILPYNTSVHFHCLLWVIFHLQNFSYHTNTHTHKGKSKRTAIPLQAWTGPEGSRSFRLQTSRQSAHKGGKVVSPTHRPSLPQEVFLVLISLRGWVDPRAIVRPEGLCQWKIPVTPLHTHTHTHTHIYIYIYIYIYNTNTESIPDIAPPILRVQKSVWTKIPYLYRISIYCHPPLRPQTAVKKTVALYRGLTNVCMYVYVHTQGKWLYPRRRTGNCVGTM